MNFFNFFLTQSFANFFTLEHFRRAYFSTFSIFSPPYPHSTLFPYTTLFRSLDALSNGGTPISRRCAVAENKAKSPKILWTALRLSLLSYFRHSLYLYHTYLVHQWLLQKYKSHPKMFPLATMLTQSFANFF